MQVYCTCKIAAICLSFPSKSKHIQAHASMMSGPARQYSLLCSLLLAINPKHTQYVTDFVLAWMKQIFRLYM